MFSWFSFFTYVLVTAITPGPNNIMSMSNGSSRGFRAALPYAFGVLTGQSVVMLLCALFCSLLSALVPKIRLPMLILGAIYILWLAWKTFRSSGEIEQRNGRGDYLSGVVLQFINPKGYLYGIVSMQAYILPHFQGETVILIGFALMLASICFLSNLCWAAFGSVLKRLFSRYAKAVNTVMALLLVYCAVSLFFTA